MHTTAIGRLVKTLHDEMANLYDHRAGHADSAALVNRATYLLFRLVGPTTEEEAEEEKKGREGGAGDRRGKVNIQAKLQGMPGGGGQHKLLVGLTRLAFSEGVYLEEGIEDGVVECAYRMLEEVVTPEEGEALLGAFGGGGGDGDGGAQD